MPATVTPAQDDIYTAVRAFVVGLLGSGVECVQGLGNRVPMPVGGFVALTAILSSRLSTNGHTYDPSGSGAVITSSAQKYTVQMDCYGPLSSDWAAILCTMWRDEYATSSMPANLQPLYADDPLQIALVDGEEQYEQRWMISAVLQYNAAISTAMQFFDTATVGVIDVDVAYPPT